VCTQLLDERFRDVFYALCDNVCDVMTQASDEREGVRGFHRRLFRWQAFLRQHGPDGLSEDMQRGLVGELLVMRDFMVPAFGGAISVSAWRGCKGAPQDFQFGKVAIEVKSTRAVMPDRIWISNVSQLDPQPADQMLLVVLHLEEGLGDWEALPALVASLRSGLAEDARLEFDNGLLEVGYLDEHATGYETPRYRPLNTFVYEVRDEFPRLIRAEIPEGIKAIKYQIGVDACIPFALDVDEFREALVRAAVEQ